jgi:ParB/RepB/Spo0J family partition protein
MRECALTTPTASKELQDSLQNLAGGEIPVRGIPVNEVRWSRFYNRNPMTLTPQNKRFAELIATIAAHGGNVSPVALFPVTDGGETIRFELAYGHRRLEATKYLKLPIVAAIVLPPLSPRDQARLQFIENSGGAEPSVLDQAKQISSQFAEGAWDSVSEMAAETGRSRAHLQHLKTIGDVVPDAVILWHPDPQRISFRDARALATLAKTAGATLETRLDQLRQIKGELKGGQATAFLLTGSSDRVPTALPSPAGNFRRFGDGLRLEVRGLSQFDAARLKALEEDLSATLAKHNVSLDLGTKSAKH